MEVVVEGRVGVSTQRIHGRTLNLNDCFQTVGVCAHISCSVELKCK